jgi:metal-responsive CopG/Arc/MetJ family transcriptional regulator
VKPRRVRISITLDPETLEAIERFWHARRLPSRSVALEELVQEGLDQELIHLAQEIARGDR